MSDHLYSVDQVAERLGLHVRTIRNYVRDGRLKAVRIGKQYRIRHEDLEAFTGGPVTAPPRETARRQRNTEVSSIVEIDAVSPRTADRVSTLLTSSLTSHDPDRQPLRIETVYNEEKARMKVIILGGPGETARLLEYIEGVLAS